MKLESNMENDVIEDVCLISIPFKSASQFIQVTEEKAGAKSRTLSCAACNWYVASRRKDDDEERVRGKLVHRSLTGELSS